ncbi:hypothetical protein B296_00030537 [Ensete ventricosum]|uniref:Uncharacterized protein n=1 Tax=Ensete ventricosum TaxID=4639 RepID=A0A426ZZ01_ENSVE|nr:hypothetical protein B296_00030537 [Ensete ventricosum]
MEYVGSSPRVSGAYQVMQGSSSEEDRDSPEDYRGLGGWTAHTQESRHFRWLTRLGFDLHPKGINSGRQYTSRRRTQEVVALGRSKDDVVGNSLGVHRELTESTESLLGWRNEVPRKKTETYRKIVEGSRKACRELKRYSAFFCQESIDDKEDISWPTVCLTEEELQVAHILYRLPETILNFDLYLHRITSPSLPDYLRWGTRRRCSISDDPPPPLPPLALLLLYSPSQQRANRVVSCCFPTVAAYLPREPLRATVRSFQPPALLLRLCSGSFPGSLLFLRSGSFPGSLR